MLRVNMKDGTAITCDDYETRMGGKFIALYQKKTWREKKVVCDFLFWKKHEDIVCESDKVSKIIPISEIKHIDVVEL